jgi:Kef-type K+ transport system membrane component KefB
VEVDINDFRRNKVKSLTFAAYSFSVPVLLGLAAGVLLLGYSLTTSALLACMFASHTLLAYPIVGRYGVTKIRSVNITVIGTAIIDTLALLTLAVIVSGHRGDLQALHWVKFLVAVAIFGATVFVGFPLIARFFFKRNTDSIAQYIFVLAMLFLSAFFAQAIGLESIIGAFITGIAFNRLIPSTSALMNRLDFVGNALFIPIFLISVGMMVDFRGLFTSVHSIVVALTMIAVAIVSKYIPAYLVQKSFRLKPVERTMIFGLSNARAAATLAAVIVGHREGLLGSEVINGSVVMILATCVVSSFATERAARRLATTHTKSVAGIGRKFGKILIPVSNPDTIDRLIEFATMIRSPKSKEPLYALYVSDRQSVTTGNWKQGDTLLEKAAFSAAASDTALEMVHCADNNIAQGIVKAIKNQCITDVVLGLHRSGLGSRQLAMRLSTLLKNTSQTVFVVRLLHTAGTFQRIVVAIPPRAEYEAGFARWLYRLSNLHVRASAKLVFYGTTATLSKIQRMNQAHEESFGIELNEYTLPFNLRSFADKLKENDLFVTVAARRTAISFTSGMDKLHDALSRHFAERNILVIYPEHYMSDEEQIKFLGGGK